MLEVNVLLVSSLRHYRIFVIFFIERAIYRYNFYKKYFVQCATADPDGQKRALVVGGGIANFTDVAATFNGIIRAMREKVNLHSFALNRSQNFNLDNILMVLETCYRSLS